MHSVIYASSRENPLISGKLGEKLIAIIWPWYLCLKLNHGYTGEDSPSVLHWKYHKAINYEFQPCMSYVRTDSVIFGTSRENSLIFGKLGEKHVGLI